MRFIALGSLFAAALCAVYDIFVKHTPLNSWHVDWVQGVGWVFIIIGIAAASRIKPKRQS